MERVAEHGIRYQCGSCGGRLLGLRPFEDLLEDGLGARMWIASEGGSPCGTCPFCGQTMRQPGPDSAAPDGIGVCHTCQQVWIASSCSAWMDSHSARREAPAAPCAAALPSSCPNCGAPLQPDELGRCRFCHTQVVASPPIEITLAEPANAGDKVLSALSRLLTDPI